MSPPGRQRRAARLCGLLAGALSFGGLAAAHGQTTPLSVDRLVPGVGPGAFLQTEGGQVPAPWTLYAGVALGALRRPLLIQIQNGTLLATPVRSRAAFDLALELGLPARVSLGLGLPVTLWQDGDRLRLPESQGSPPLATAAVGDIRLRGKAALLPRPWPVALGVLLELTVPGGGQGDFAASPGPTFATRLLFSAAHRWLSAAVNLGARFAPRRDLLGATFGHRLDYGAALAGALLSTHPRRPGVSLLAEVAGSLEPIIDPAPTVRHWPIEARGALRLAAPLGQAAPAVRDQPFLTVDVGAGAGLNDQPTALTWRAFLILRGQLDLGGPSPP